MNKQHPIDLVFLDMAASFAHLSKCVKHQVGSLLVKDNRIVSTGYNGTVKGTLNCNERWDPNHFDRDAHRAWSADYEIHSEMNALLFAAKNGIATKDTTLYCTMKPCHNCLKHLIQAGIQRIVYRQDHARIVYTSETLELIRISGLKLEQL